MQAGFSGMNEVTVLQASQGLAVYVLKSVKDAISRGVVIGHDHRHNSKRFAEIAAMCFSHLNFKVFLYDGLVHTPLVPFGVIELDAALGIMITASHNPAQDNGYKVYWENGCQIIPPLDLEISQEIENNLTPWTWDTSLVTTDPKMTEIILEKYFSKIKSTLIDEHIFELTKNVSDLPIVYTAMHGVGNEPFQEISKLLGLSNNIINTEKQMLPDPDFSTVKFPNPEESGALDIAKIKADETGANIILANDPDADRFAVAVKDRLSGSWVQLTGNQLGALFADYELKRYNSTPELSIKPLAFLNSTVSSQLIRTMAIREHFHYEDTLTGFKWIGNRAQELVKSGYFVPFAFEEAIGYMFEVVFDKDGISAAVVFLQMVIKWHLEGTTALEELEKIYQKYGFFAEYNSYFIANDSNVISSVFNKIRYGNDNENCNYFKGPPKMIGVYKVISWRDLTIGYDSTTVDNKPKLPVSSSSQMITVELESLEQEKIRFTARGSGTEPKLKVYIEANSKTGERAKRLAKKVWDLLGDEWFHELK